MTLRFVVVILTFLVIFCGNLQADVITYTEQAVAMGAFGPPTSTSFNNALVTITFVGDTGNVTRLGRSFLVNSGGLVTLNVSGIGTATFTEPIDVFVDQLPNFFGPPQAWFGNSDSQF